MMSKKKHCQLNAVGIDVRIGEFFQNPARVLFLFWCINKIPLFCLMKN